MDPEIGRRFDKQDEILSKQTDNLTRIEAGVQHFIREVVGDRDRPEGRLSVVEKKIENLEEHKNRTLGILAALTFLGGLVEALFHWKK